MHFEYARAMPEPVLRASDDDRDAVLRALERHTAVGRLNLAEFGAAKFAFSDLLKFAGAA